MDHDQKYDCLALGNFGENQSPPAPGSRDGTTQVPAGQRVGTIFRTLHLSLICDGIERQLAVQTKDQGIEVYKTYGGHPNAKDQSAG